MNRRTFEGPMEWEWEDQGPIDLSSPFAQLSRKQQMGNFGSSQFQSFGRMPNPFANTASRTSPIKPSLQPQEPAPPNASIFNPQIQKPPTGSSFRNPAFTTPQKRVEELLVSEASGAEESPALTDTSEMPADTPDLDRAAVDFARSTITPATANRTLFGKAGSSMRSRTPGRGEIARGTRRDKVRKRKRIVGDRDVGSVRSRLPHDSADSDSDWEDKSLHKSGKSRRQEKPGLLGNWFATINAHPHLPAILSHWLRLGVNFAIILGATWGAWSVISSLLRDVTQMNMRQRARLLEEMTSAKNQYTVNQCMPGKRVPALTEACDAWEAIMNQDPDAVMNLESGARTFAGILNAFVQDLSLQAWGFVAMLILVGFCANILLGGPPGSPYPPSAKGHIPDPSLVAPTPMALPSSQDPNQAYILAPIGQTPRHLKHALFGDNATDTDTSPSGPKAIMAPRTPSFRRSPSKSERGRSPTKYGRTPSREY